MSRYSVIARMMQRLLTDRPAWRSCRNTHTNPERQHPQRNKHRNSVCLHHTTHGHLLQAADTAYARPQPSLQTCSQQ